MATQRQSLTVKLTLAEIRISELEAQLATALTPKAATQTPARIAYMARPRTTEPSPFQMACAAAKAAAMAKGIVTRVGV